MLAIILLNIVGLVLAQFPSPFTRELTVTSPMMNGTDVIVLQNLIARQKGVFVAQTQYYDPQTAQAVRVFQEHSKLPVTGNVDADTAAAVLEYLSYDGYHDDGRPAAELGYLYKVYIPVYRNRSIETNATLYAGNGTELFKFRVRAHGCEPDGCQSWPDFNNTNYGLNMFSSDGDTPTGLMEFDLNSPEPEPQLYGPYPVNRAVQGLLGNALFLVPNIRDGILLHTGEWPNWNPPQNMPNSEGCVHSWPQNIDTIWQTLIGLGVQVRPNPFGVLPYPYIPQGLLSIEQID